MPTMTYSETLVVTHCWCGIALAIPENLHSWMNRREGAQCYCPVGHKFEYSNTVEQENRKLKADLEAADQQHRATRDLLRAEERSHAATRGQITKLKRRASAGVCPCCNRTFQNLARHMGVKHPDYGLNASPTSETT